jgi:3-dehydroquinate synthase
MIKPSMKQPEQRTVTLDLAERSYSILVGSEARHRFANLFQEHGRGRAFWVTDRNVAEAWGSQLGKLCGQSGDELTILPPGEDQKKLSTVDGLSSILVNMGVERGDTLVACGGGVVGDIVGFTAACYQRGISFVQMPTTLLAMVDASVGGKTGVDLPEGKNLVGAFHQPLFVVADVDFLETLNPREFRSGYAEVIKTALIGDVGLFDELKGDLQARVFDLEKGALIHIIEACVKYKASVVSQDERESDNRRVLNFGHTVGHALEALGEYSRLKHGEAIYWGVTAAVDLSVSMGLLHKDIAGEIHSVLEPHLAQIPALDFNDDGIFEYFSRDKKVSRGKPNFVLLEGIGQPVITDRVDSKQLEAVLYRLRERMKSYS